MPSTPQANARTERAANKPAAPTGAGAHPERQAWLRGLRPRAGGVEADLRGIREGSRTARVERRDAYLRWSLACADLAAATLGLFGSIALGGARPTPAAVAALPVIVLFCKLGRLYDRDEAVIRKSTLDQAPSLLQVATVYVLIAWLASGVLVTGGLGKADVAVMWVLLLTGLLAFRHVARRLAARAMPPERVLVLGGAEAAVRLTSRIETAHDLRAEVVGRVALQFGDREAPPPLGMIDDLDHVVRSNEVERVIIVPVEATSDEMLETIRLVKALGVKVSVLPRLFEVVGSSLEFDDVDGITVLGLRRYGLPRSSWYVKRTFDLVVAVTALVLLTPLLAVIALAVRLTSPGSILFRQPRVGRKGAHFDMLKFRTMYDGADGEKAKLVQRNEAAGLFKIADDPRVTPIGRILRPTSLDELPQFFNVLRGEMSLVGPRPLVVEEDRKIADWHHRRREGTPGMTGVWQVLGPTRVSLDDMVKLDYLYRANWSLWLDVKILLRTAGHVLSRRGM
jgi:exopolysaccharide biosynthesis polyprenyl glycosylphosphotransferase